MRLVFTLMGATTLALFYSYNGYGQDLKLSPPEACCSSVIVADLEQSKSWYTTVLGFELDTQFNNKERGIAIANMKHGKLRLELIKIANSLDRDSLNKGSAQLRGLFKFGMRIADFDDWIRHLSSFLPDILAQVVTDPITQKRMVVLKDPDGNRLQLFEE